MAEPRCRHRPGIIGVDRHGALGVGNRGGLYRAVGVENRGVGAPDELDGIGSARPARSGTAHFGSFDCRIDMAGDAGGDAVLQREHIIEAVIEMLRPDLFAGDRIDQPCRNPHATAGAAHAAFKQVAHAEFARDLLRGLVRVAVGQARLAGDDEQALEA